ncbi:MAG: metallopeptidase family protein [Phycisphaerales bacterium]
MTPEERAQFDAILEQVIESLPPRVREVLDEVPVIVLDRPDEQTLRQVGLTPDEAGDLCGLHTGTMRTERSIEEPWRLPSQIHLFREGIIGIAGGICGHGAAERVREQIRVTLLHEVGHELGLDEDQLWELGYD